jgi:hypothetical protein
MIRPIPEKEHDRCRQQDCRESQHNDVTSRGTLRRCGLSSFARRGGYAMADIRRLHSEVNVRVQRFRRSLRRKNRFNLV